MSKYFSFIISIFLLSACKQQSEGGSDSCHLVETDKRIEIPIDSETNIYTRAMHYFVEDGIEYITIENSENLGDYNTLNFYRLDTKSLSHKVKIAKEGDHGVPQFMGHGIDHLDNLFISGSGTVIYQMNREGRIKKKLDYTLTDRQEYTTSNDFNTLVYKPLTIVDGKIYLMQYPMPPNANKDQLTHTSLTITIDTLTGEVTRLPLTYPALWEDGSGMGVNPHCSRIYDGKQFVYAFRMSDNILVTEDHVHSRTIPVRSRYIRQLQTEGFPKDLSFDDFVKRSDEQATYGNILYDKYRKVYYRFAYPECEVDKNYIEYIFCRKEFSVILIDEQFNVIGERLFPAGKYAPGLFFINEDGLYISENNIENSEASEDKLVFRCFSIDRKETD